MVKLQRGLSIIGLIFVLIVVAAIALFVMKLAPSFIEFRSAKTAIEGIAAQNPQSPAEARKAFEARSIIDNIESVKPADLDISRDGDQIVLGFSYRKEIQLFPHVGLYIDYTAHAGGE